MADLTKELVELFELAGYYLEANVLVPTKNTGFSLEDGDLLYVGSYSGSLYKAEVMNEAQVGDYVDIKFEADTDLTAAPDAADYTYKFLIYRDGSATFSLTAEYVDLYTSDDLESYVVRAVSGAVWTAV